MKLPKGKLASIRRQMKEKVEEGELEARENTGVEWTGERPEKKRSIKRNAKAQARCSDYRPTRSRSFTFEAGDLVEVHSVQWNMRSVKKGDVGMVISVEFNGERITLQVGPHLVTVPGASLRPLPDYDDEEPDE